MRVISDINKEVMIDASHKQWFLKCGESPLEGGHDYLVGDEEWNLLGTLYSESKQIIILKMSDIEYLIT